MKTSLIIPSRERIGLLINCLNSFYNNANNKNNVETIIIADDDDSSFDNFESYINYTNFDIKLYKVPRSNFCQRDYNNYGGAKASGDLIWIMNDDCTILTKEWDLILEKKVQEIFCNQKDKILYLGMLDGTHGKNTKHAHQQSCCFPIISKESFNVTKTIMPNEIHMWGADIYLFRIYQRLKTNRIYFTDEIELQHHSMHSQITPREIDNINFNVANISKNCNLTDNEINYYVNAINQEVIL